MGICMGMLYGQLRFWWYNEVNPMLWSIHNWVFCLATGNSWKWVAARLARPRWSWWLTCKRSWAWVMHTTRSREFENVGNLTTNLYIIWEGWKHPTFFKVVMTWGWLLWHCVAGGRLLDAIATLQDDYVAVSKTGMLPLNLFTTGWQDGYTIWIVVSIT